MPLPSDRWLVEPASDADQRLALLDAPGDFDTVASNIASSLEVLCGHRSQIQGTDFKRPVYTLKVTRPLFDQFFNASYGYRAAFYQSPGTGMDANRLFLKAITPRLLADHSNASIHIDSKLIAESLTTPSAKAWLAESGKEPCRDCPTCWGEWSTGNCGPPELAEIRNGRWETANSVKAEWGRKAPYLTKLRVMGAFLDVHRNELVPHDKRARAQEIHDFGWS